jgi:phosphatidylserine/phosphatidylglycerophosphate/cardiolipin synthase-like enzyme
VEPEEGMGAIYSFLSQARNSLDLTMYELVDPEAEQILVADQARGVRVRVLLDKSREGEANLDAFDYLHQHGVAVEWASPTFAATHEKAAIEDAGQPSARLLIMTLNLTERYYSSTRDFAVIDSTPNDVAAGESVFDGDFAGTPNPSPSDGADLVWSPGSQDALVSLIDSARRSLLVENEEMSDSGVVEALVRAAQRGVKVEVVMTADTEWDHEFAELTAAGVDVRIYPDSSGYLYIHAKALVADGSVAFVGSENFSAASLGYNRELGLITSEHAVSGDLSSVISSDFAGGRPWVA